MELSEDQKQIIIENSNSISDLTELTALVFPDKSGLDGRSKEGRAVRAFLVSEGINYQTKHILPKENIALDEEQKEFVSNNSSDGLNAFQIAGMLFPETNITGTSKEYEAVLSFIDGNDSLALHPSEDVAGKNTPRQKQ